MEYNKDEAIKEIDKVLGIEEVPEIPKDAVNSGIYAERKGLSRGWASSLLRDGFNEGKLNRAKKNGRLWYWPKTV